MYCNEAAFTARFGPEELEQVTATNGGLDFDDAAADADALIDSYLGAIAGRSFLLPLAVPPARIVGVAADLTRYELWANRASEEIRTRRDQALDYLKDLVAGRAVLLLVEPETEVPSQSPAGRVGYRTNGRVFTDSTLAGYTGNYDCDPLAGLRGSCD